MKILKRIGQVIAALIFLFILFLVFATISDYKPPEKEIIFASNQPDTINTELKISFLLWNIGYCGLGKDMDFFYDGGSQVRTSHETTVKNLESIQKFLSNHDSCQFILLQEVDQKSKRTYRINEVETFSTTLSNHNPFFAKNYKVKFVPVPPTSPMGMVNSGVLTFSEPVPSSSIRYNFPGDYSWPTNLFMLDRCFLVNRYPLPDGKEFLVINSHNSAFDDGSLKAAEMDYLKKFLLDEYEKGNYVIVGADWNQNPPGFSPKEFSSELTYERFQLNAIEKDFMPEGWEWIYFPSVPTNRNLATPYDPQQSTLTILDFYLLSPNLHSSLVKTIDLSFENADHQPVILDLHFSKDEPEDTSELDSE